MPTCTVFVMATKPQQDQSTVPQKSRGRTVLKALAVGLSCFVAAGALAASHKELTADLAAQVTEALVPYRHATEALVPSLIALLAPAAGPVEPSGPSPAE